MTIFMLNSDRRNHARLYGPGAFYDLNTSTHADLIRDVETGQKCVVANPIGENLVCFDWFAFLCEEQLPSPTNQLFRVFSVCTCGQRCWTRTWRLRAIPTASSSAATVATGEYRR